jgi:hypothetical protein
MMFFVSNVELLFLQWKHMSTLGEAVHFLAHANFKNLFIGAGRVTQVVECLPSKNEALSSNPSVTKRKSVYWT